MEGLQIARFYNVDPDVVDYSWNRLDYLARREFMMVQNWIDGKYREALERNVDSH